MTNETKTPKHSLFWHLYAQVYDGIRFAMPYRKLLWDTYSNLSLTSGQRLLDAGCGTGNFERFLVEKSAPEVQIQAIDFSSAMLSRAKKKCTNLPHVSFEIADLNRRLNFPDESFDHVVCLNVLYAVQDPHFTLQEFFRVLKPGGMMIIANPRPSAKFAPLVRDHFKRIKNIWGIHRQTFAFVKSIFMMGTTGVAPIMLNTFVIVRRGKKRKYHFLPKSELKEMFEQNDLGNLDVIAAYADQNWLTTATKSN